MSLFPPEMLEGPAAPPPDEFTMPQLDNPPNSNAMVIGVITACMAVTTIFVAIRGFAKIGYLKLARFEDYLLMPMFATYLAFCVYWLKMSGTTGHYVHIWDFRLKNLAPFFKNGYYAVNFFGATMLTLKPAILLEWVHIFGAGSRNTFVWTCYAVIAINSLLYLIGIFVESFSCSPRAAYWDKTIPDGKCIPNVKYLSLISSVVNLALDIVIVVLPQKIIWKLNITKAKKLGVSLVFMVGLVSVAAAIVRMVFSILYIDSGDVTYNLSQVGLWCVVEMSAGILVFVAPAVPKPMKYLAKQVGSSIDRLVNSRSYSKQTSAYPYSENKVHGSESYEMAGGSGKSRFIKLRFSRSKNSMRNNQEHQNESEAEIVPAVPTRT